MTSPRALTAAVLLLTACGTASDSPLPTEVVTVGDQELTVWVADEPEEQSQGLMGMDDLPEGVDGMLFAYSAPRSVTFHMFDTRLALDIWWFDDSGTLIGGTRMEPCAAEPCTSYGSPGPIRWALETPAGVVDLSFDEMLSTTGNG